MCCASVVPSLGMRFLVERDHGRQVLREDIIKLQHEMKSTRERWSGSKRDFYLIFHEHPFVFRKPAEGEKVSDYRNSAKWW